MKAIGFRNFRKFENLPVLEMGDITIVSVLTFLKNTKFQAPCSAPGCSFLFQPKSVRSCWYFCKSKMQKERQQRYFLRNSVGKI